MAKRRKNNKKARPNRSKKQGSTEKISGDSRVNQQTTSLHPQEDALVNEMPSTANEGQEFRLDVKSHGKETGGTEQETKERRLKPRRRCKKMPWTPFPFLFLPPELRNRIYREVLLIENGLKGYHHHTMKRENMSIYIEGASLYFQPPLTRTSRQIRAETLAIYYGENEIWASLLDLKTRNNEQTPCGAAVNLAAKLADNLRLSSVVRIIFCEVHLLFLAPAEKHRATQREIIRHSFFQRREQYGTRCLVSGHMMQAARIGDDQTDWSNKSAVELALREALPKGGHYHNPDDACPWLSCLLDVLWALSREVPNATKCLYYYPDDFGDFMGAATCPYNGEIRCDSHHPASDHW